ncbi:transmembrane protein [Pandoraea pneumonica]|jgi:type IV pilus assembly protein PilW|uniref:Transmembrane protein n=1 Tax=Pandoraea pneumonica TaxID=2508299 RepID=A0A5E4YES0_9BURK|nr:PilW family protein [Pandoraea pneumonica]VVE46845.1 transmembrane protein [Pandoraea pneumonica]
MRRWVGGYRRGSLGARRARGFTLLELTLAMPLGLLVVMAAIAIYLAGLRLWRVQAARLDVQERAVFALTQLTRAVHMAGYRNWDPMEGVAKAPSQGKRDWTSLRASAECAGNVDTCPSRGWQGSALIEVQYHGAGVIQGNGAVQNCGGRRVGSTHYTADTHRNVFYVGKGEDGIPSLFCRYSELGQVPPRLQPAQVLVGGVEAMYVRLGVRSGSGGTLRWIDPVKSARGKPPVSPAGVRDWENVAAVAFSLVLRGAPRAGGKPGMARVVEVFDAASGGRAYQRLTNAGQFHLHVMTAIAHRRNDGGFGREAAWLASS